MTGSPQRPGRRARGVRFPCPHDVRPSQFCSCLQVRPVRDALRDLYDEIVEFLQEPSRDEASDLAFAVGRLIGGMRGIVYTSIPGDARHITKMFARMATYGCVRSPRHLRDGACPSLPTSTEE